MRFTLARNLTAMVFASAAFACITALAVPYSIVASITLGSLAIGTLLGGWRGAAWTTLDLPNLVFGIAFASVSLLLVIATLIQALR